MTLPYTPVTTYSKMSSSYSVCLKATVLLLLLVIGYLMLVPKDGVYYVVLGGGVDETNGSCQVGSRVNLTTPTYNSGHNTRLEDKPRGQFIAISL